MPGILDALGQLQQTGAMEPTRPSLQINPMAATSGLGGILAGGPIGNAGLGQQLSNQTWFHGTQAPFERFNEPAGLGIHFGTQTQANYKANEQPGSAIIPAKLDIRNPIRLSDHIWDDPRTLANGLKQFDMQGRIEGAAKNWEQLKSLKVNDDLPVDEYRAQAKSLRDSVWASKQSAMAEGRAALQAAGYDSVVYKNEVEGSGDSVIIFSPNQIKSPYGLR